MATITIDDARVRGDMVRVQGSVDGVKVEVKVWKSHIDSLVPGGTNAQKKQAARQYVAGELKTAHDAAQAGTPLDLNGAAITL